MWLAVSLFALLLWLSAATALCVGMRRIESLTDVPPAADADCPSLSVVVPACNEAAAMEPALRSLLALDYPHLELIVVDDRSTDGTAAIVERLAAAHPQLRLLRVSELPSRWLGKNHALQVGSQAAGGDWLLFTDADVVFQPGALRRPDHAHAQLAAAGDPARRNARPAREVAPRRRPAAYPAPELDLEAARPEPGPVRVRPARPPRSGAHEEPPRDS